MTRRRMLRHNAIEAWQAMQQKNPGAVVSAIRQLDHMTGTGYNSNRGYGINRRKC